MEVVVWGEGGRGWRYVVWGEGGRNGGMLCRKESAAHPYH